VAAAVPLWELRQRYHDDDRGIFKELLEKFNRKYIHPQRNLAFKENTLGAHRIFRHSV